MPGIVRIFDRMPASDDFRADVLAGLARTPKSIPPKYFYDAAGSALFERICELPEYYPTRTELAIMHADVNAIAQLIGRDTRLVELGSGASTKTRLLIEAARPAAYIPIDISRAALELAAAALARDYAWLNILPLCADFTRPVELPRVAGIGTLRDVVYFPGSTIGNFTPEEALVFLRHVRELVGAGVLVIGVDLKKDKPTLDAAYDDAQGVTAAFNLNLLTRINRELGGDFQLERFRHVAFYDVAKGRIEMHLESVAAQRVQIAGRVFDFAAGERIHTENSCKYTIEEFVALGRAAGFESLQVWTDPARLFSVHAWRSAHAG